MSPIQAHPNVTELGSRRRLHPATLRRRQFTLALMSSVFLAGCANPTFTQMKPDFTPRNWRAIAVLPFAGDARLAAAATDAFSARLPKLNSLRLIQPSETKVIVRRLGIVAAPSGFTVLEVQRVATEVDADAVIVGVVSSYNNWWSARGFSTVQLIDSRSGEVVAMSHHPTAVNLLGNSAYQDVMVATERVSKEMARILADLERKNQLTPRKIE